MLIKRSVNFTNNTSQTFAFDEPDECPLCHFSIKPVKLHSYGYYHDLTKYFTEMYLCSHCAKPFIALYVCTNKSVPVDGIDYSKAELEYIGPKHFTPKTFEEQINDLSTQFVKIYNQAAAAEAQELDEIAGIGYRKAIEFLVKDFAIHLHPDDADTIKRKFLSSCIQDYITSPEIKTLATGAVWIGNDETHYIRRQEDRDVGDMKRFIQAMVYFVGMHLISEDAGSMTPS